MFRSGLSLSAFALGLLVFGCAAPALADLPEIGTTTVHDEGTAPAQYDARDREVITRAEFEARGAETVADALRYSAGFAVLSYGPFGTTGAISVDGSNQSDELLVLLDGIPLNLGSSGGVDLTTMPLAGIERIEITRGGASTLYGSNAVAGVINLITGRSKTVDAAVTRSSFHDTDLRASTAVDLGSGSLDVAAERHTAGNVFPFPAAASFGSASGYTAGTRQNSDAQLDLGRVVYDSKADGKLQYHALLETGSLHLGVAGQEPYLTLNARENSDHFTGGASAIYTQGAATTTVALSTTTNNDTYVDAASDYDSTAPATAFSEDSTLDRRDDFAVRHGITYAHSQWVTGVNLTRETAQFGLGLENYPGAPTQTAAQESQSALFTQVVHNYTGGSRFYVGLRGENDHPQGGSLSPAIGGTYNFVKNYSLHAEVGNSYRVPTLLDLYYPGFSNPALQPEKSRTFSATLTAQRILGGVSIGTFSREAHNLIADNAQYVPENINRATIQGLQETLATPLQNGIRLKATFTQTFKAEDITNPQMPTRLAYVPWGITTFTLEHPMNGRQPGYGIDGNIYGAIEQYSGPAASGFTTIDSFLQLPLQDHATLSLRARNIGDERYEIVSGYPLPGRSFEVELSTR